MMRRLPLVTALLLLAGCAVGPDYQRPASELPENYRSTPPAAAGQATLAELHWREVFTDPPLQNLIEEALAAGPDALLAAARLREAEALAGIARAPLLPQASLSLNTSATVPASRATAIRRPTSAAPASPGKSTFGAVTAGPTRPPRPNCWPVPRPGMASRPR